MRKRRQVVRNVIAGMLAAASMVAGCGSDDNSQVSASTGATSVTAYDDSVLTGTITYAQRIVLPRDARVVVSLIDLSRAGSSDAVVAERQFEAGGHVPIGFELPYDSARIVHGHTYGVRAQILVDGALWFINEQPVPILTRGNFGSAQVPVRPAADG